MRQRDRGTQETQSLPRWCFSLRVRYPDSDNGGILNFVASSGAILPTLQGVS